MITVVFSGNENVKNYITGLWQWDYGQTLRIQGLDLPTAVEIHFSLAETEGEAVTRIGTTKDGVTDVVIPDSMLENQDAEKDYNIYAFIYVVDSESGETVKRITLKVKARPRPEGFDTPDDAELFREAIKEVNNAADRAEEAEENASEYAAQTKQDAEQTAEDRREVERIVETVSDIGEHVDTVREYRDQAQTAATNALLSEQKATETKEAVIAAQAGAESAANAAEEYAEQTAQDATQTASDRAEVERLIGTVSDIGEHVQTVKEYKDQAQAAATNALLAESESEKAKEDALLAQTGAESAADEAERHALDVAGDKTEVERLAAQVREDKDAVEQSKTSVENTVQDFGQTVQQANESINTVAAEKVSAVQNAGTQAVGQVNTAKGEAVKAVEDKCAEQAQKLEDKGKEILESFPTAPDLDAKLDKQQGVKNAGKALVIGEDGNVVPGEVQTSIEVDTTLTKEGKAADAKATGDKILQYAIKNTAQGTNITLNDSAEEKLLDLKMQGWTEQETLEGINLFNLEKALKIESWYPRESAQPSFQFGIKVDKGYRYSLSVEENNMDISNVDKICISTTDFKIEEPYGDMLKPGNKLASPEITSSGWIYIIIYTSKEFNSQFLEEIFLGKLKNLQIQKGSVALPYEPYVGGKPIPNPENPREIINAGKKDEDIGKYTVDVKLTGKNLFDMEKASDLKNWIVKTYAYFELPTKTGKEYTLSFEADSKGKTIWIGIFKATEGAKDAVELMIWGTTANAVGKKTTFIAHEHTYIGIFPVGNQSELQQRFTEIISDMQLEEGNVKTEYEPYKKQLVTLTADRPLTKFDRLEKQDGVWGWLFKTGTLNLADATVWSINDDGYTNNETHRIYTPIPDVVANSEAFCNKLYPFMGGDISGIKVADYECFNISNSSYLQMKLLKERGTTVDELKAFFAGNDIYVLYPSVNEEFVPLTQEEQDMLNNLHTYYPATVISNGEECEMEVTYAADTTTYVNNKIAEIAATILKGV